MEDGLKKNAKIVFQGVEGAYSHAALLSCFGKDADCFCVHSFKDAAEAVVSGQADYGVLPVENSSAGVVSDVLALLYRYEVYVVRQVYLPVRHCLLGLEGAREEDVKTIVSHPQALMQCSDYLESRTDVRSISMVNTAVAARKVVEDGDITQAAIASSTAGEIYGLKVIREELNNVSGNTTRFVVISGEKTFLKDAANVSIMFELPHKSGSLSHMLTYISGNGLNMTRIASMPIPERPFEYRFLIGFEGALCDPAVQNALGLMGSEARAFKIMGCY